MRPKHITQKQRTALLAAYSTELDCIADRDVGVHPRTVAALLKASLLRPSDDDSDVYVLTEQGAQALGILDALRCRPVSALQAAVIASELFAPDVFTVLDRDEHTGPQPDEGEADWQDVVAWLLFEPAGDDGDEVVEAIATLVTELGYAVYAEGVRDGVIALWRDDES